MRKNNGLNCRANECPYLNKCLNKKVVLQAKAPSYKRNKYIRGTYDKFPDFFRMGTFIDSTHMKLKSPPK